ncbi:MAG: hypothetical protein HOK57_00490 [Planctomycetaceae bacterium]|jgi:hypothetical protein|nr:hypothetical protein [Planctomycetaceae bacterium]
MQVVQISLLTIAGLLKVAMVSGLLVADTSAKPQHIVFLRCLPVQDSPDRKVVLLTAGQKATKLRSRKKRASDMAAEVIVSVKHGLPVDTVKERLTKSADDFSGLEFVPDWKQSNKADVALSYGGFSTNGNISISESIAIVTVKIPRVARLFSGKIKAELTKAMEKALLP